LANQQVDDKGLQPITILQGAMHSCGEFTFDR